MQTTIHIQNLKCGGCANTITKGISSIETINNIAVNVEDSSVTFDYVSEEKLNEVKDGLFKLEENRSIFNVPGQIESAKNRVDNFGKQINNVNQDLIENTPIIIGIMILSYIILPLLIIFLLYNLMKIIFFEKISK